MAEQVVVLVPALGRPHRVEALSKSLRDSREGCDLRLLYLLSPGDDAQAEAVRAAHLDYIVMGQPAGHGDYAAKINLGIRETTEEWVFLGADDLHFWPAWADEAITMAKTTGRTVIGTNDLGNGQVKRGLHSTHTLVHRSYVERGTVDDASKLLHEGYQHNWVDAEFIETAKHREQFVFAWQSIVEHLHPHWRKGEMDDTYRKGLAGFEQDRRLFKRRQGLWNLGSQIPLTGVSLAGTKRQNAARWQSRHHP